jgi:endoribonuclease Dicer
MCCSCQLLSDVLEAVLGAAFASGGCELRAVEPLFERVFRPILDAHISLGTLAHHPTKVMCELLESYGCSQFALEKRPAHGGQGVICEGEYLVMNISVGRSSNKHSHRACIGR